MSHKLTQMEQEALVTRQVQLFLVQPTAVKGDLHDPCNHGTRRDLGVVVVDSLREVIARLQHTQDLGDDVLAHKAFLLAVHIELSAGLIDFEVVRNPQVIVQVESRVISVPAQVVHDVGTDSVTDHLAHEGRQARLADTQDI